MCKRGQFTFASENSSVIEITGWHDLRCSTWSVNSQTAERQKLFSRLDEQYAWVLDAGVFLCLSVLILYTISRHEPWADEAETWVEVRDIPWLQLVFGQLRYDGHLPLWYSVVWLGQHVFRLSYDHFVFIGGACGIAGLAVLMFLAPFPRALRYIIGGSFFFSYQYAVVARPYVLMPLLGLLAVYFYRRGMPHIYGFALTVAVLIQDSSYAAVIGTGLAAFYAWQLACRWGELSLLDRKRVWRAAGIIAASVAFAFIVLYPPSDSSLISEAAHESLSHRLNRLGEGLTGAFAERSIVPALPLLILACLWSYVIRGWLLLILIVGGTAAEYGFLRGFGHHQGLITIAFVVFVCARWPQSNEIATMPSFSRVIHYGFAWTLALTFAWQCSWSYIAMKADWEGPYTGAKDAAQYLKAVGADKLGVAGYTFWSVGVQPYFDHNIFLNYGGPHAPARYHFAFEFEKHTANVMSSELESGPPFLVFAPEITTQEAVPVVQEFRSYGYLLVHYSPGTKYFKTTGTPAPYFIFERSDFVAGTSRARGSTPKSLEENPQSAN